MSRKRKPPAALTCQICHQSKPPTTEFWYLESKHHTEACKECVERRILEQVPEIQRQVEAGTRRAAHWRDYPKENAPLVES